MTTLLRRRDAVHYLRDRHGLSCALQTLAKLACVGGGPRFHRWGRYPVYAPADLDAWVASKLTGPLTSTSTPIDEAKPLGTVRPGTEPSAASLAL